MSNMSYCRFENTYTDLSDCQDNILNVDESNVNELVYRRMLIKACKEIADNYSYLLDN